MKYLKEGGTKRGVQSIFEIILYPYIVSSYSVRAWVWQLGETRWTPSYNHEFFVEMFEMKQGWHMGHPKSHDAKCEG